VGGIEACQTIIYTCMAVLKGTAGVQDSLEVQCIDVHVGRGERKCVLAATGTCVRRQVGGSLSCQATPYTCIDVLYDTVGAQAFSCARLARVYVARSQRKCTLVTAGTCVRNQVGGSVSCQATNYTCMDVLYDPIGAQAFACAQLARI
jgi:hypothetical protein